MGNKARGSEHGQSLDFGVVNMKTNGGRLRMKRERYQALDMERRWLFSSFSLFPCVPSS